MAMGIGALIGGLGAKQKGGNFLKGALQGAALGGITGGLGAKYGSGTGMFGWGTKMMPNFLAMSGIQMGSEMMGQGDANRRQMEQQRRWLDEEEERRIARLSRIAGYDVADSANFMTPNKYFVAEGGMISKPGYYNGGISSLEDDPANAVNIQEMQMDPGTMGPGGLTEEFDYMDEASLNPEIQKLYRAFLIANQTTEEEVPVEMFMQLMQQQGGGQGEQQGPMMAAEGGQVNRPGYAWGGASSLNIGNPHRDPEPFYGGRSPAEEQTGFARQEIENIVLNSQLRDIENEAKQNQTFGWDYEEDEQGNMVPAYTRGFEAAEGGSVMGKDEYDEELNRPQMFLGGALGIGAILGLGKLLGGRRRKERRSDVKNKFLEKAPIFKVPRPVLDDEDDLPVHALLEHQPMLGVAKGGGIGDLDLRGGGASVGPGTGTSDDIPAMLSDGEFVVTSNAVTNLGGGDRMLGAQRMYRMMNQLDPNSQTPAEMSGVGYA
jgi:hypothetical protein